MQHLSDFKILVKSCAKNGSRSERKAQAYGLSRSILEEYGRHLERALSRPEPRFLPENSLPHPKEKIRTAILFVMGFHEATSDYGLALRSALDSLSYYVSEDRYRALSRYQASVS